MNARGILVVGAAVLVACAPDPPEHEDEVVSDRSLLTRSATAAIVGMTNALSSPAQRHVVRIQPPNHRPVYLMAVQNDGYSYDPHGLLWYRSDDMGATWSYYRPIVARPDPATYDGTLRPSMLHLTADLVVVGNDVAAVYSYDTTRGSFPADAWDPRRVVYFQWWRFDGVDDWVPGRRVTVASPGAGQAYRRAVLARDGAGRLWVAAFLRRSDCAALGSASCAGDLLQAWVSADAGASFQGPQGLAALPNQLGGGRLVSLGSQLLMLFGDYSARPAQLLRRRDADPPTQWSAQANAFADGAHIYHGASLSAAPDGAGGLHLVYKQWVASPDTHRLYYRHHDGSSFGPARAIGGPGDWATQPAITAVGGDVQICVNHLISTNASYELRSYRLSSGFAEWEVVDDVVQAKAYPAAPERVPEGDGTIPCAFGQGNNTTQVWGAGHTVQVAQQVARAAAAIAAPPTFSPAPGSYASAQAVTLSSATGGAAIFFTTDGATPTTGSTRYTGPITVATTTTIRAIATASGYATSAVASGTFTIQPAQGGGAVLFSDEFDRTGGLGAGWRSWYGSHALDGARAVSGPPPIYGNWAAVTPSPATSDYAVVATLSIPSGSLYSGIVARSRGSDFTSDLYTAQLSSSGTVNLYRRNGWTWTLLRSVGAGIQVDRFYVLELAATGSAAVHLEVWLDGVRLISHDDASSGRHTSGAAGIVSYGSGVRYEALRVLSR